MGMKIANALAFPKRALSSARQAMTRLKTRQGSVRTVKLAHSQRSHRAESKPARRGFLSRSLFSRKVKAPSPRLTGRNGEQDGAALVNILRGGKADSILRAVHDTAVNPDIRQGEGVGYNRDLYLSVHEQLGTMKNTDLLKLYKTLNGKEMTQLRAGLKADQNEATLGVKKEFSLTSRHLESLTKLVQAEIGLKRALINDFPAPPLDQEISEEAKNTLQQFEGEIAPHISSSSGDVPSSVLELMQNDFTKLAHESEAGLPDKSINKEGGICHLEPENSKSEELNVSEIYIADFHRMEKHFDDGEQVMSNHQLGWESRDRKEISDHITEFCGGNVNQARRVSALLSQQAVAGLYKLQYGGELASYPDPTGGQKTKWDGFEGEKEVAQTITRLGNGDVRIRTRQTFEPFMFSQFAGEHIKYLPVSDKKSLMRVDMDVVVPAPRSAAPQITHFSHASHIVVEPPVTARAAYLIDSDANRAAV